MRAVPGNPAVVMVVGNDERGVLFGVGNLLRELRMKRQAWPFQPGFRLRPRRNFR